METLKEYADFLYKNGYKEASTHPYGSMFQSLDYVWFVKNEFHVRLQVYETEEFSNYLESLEEGAKFKIEYENYIVDQAFIDSPIRNVCECDYKDGIMLVSEPDDVCRHSLDLFEQCIKFQTTNLVVHELFIMSRREEQLGWAKDNLIPVLEKHDFYCNHSSLFHTSFANAFYEGEDYNSNPRIDFQHPYGASIVMEIDCITGEPIIWATSSLDDLIKLTDKIYGKNLNEVSEILQKEIFEEIPENWKELLENYYNWQKTGKNKL